MAFLNLAVRGNHDLVVCGYKADLDKWESLNPSHPTRTFHRDALTDPYAHNDSAKKEDISGKEKWGAGAYQGLYVAKNAESIFNVYDRIQFGIAQLCRGEKRESLFKLIEKELSDILNRGVSINGEIQKLQEAGFSVDICDGEAVLRSTGTPKKLVKIVA